MIVVVVVAVVLAATIILWSAYTLRAEGHGFSRLRRLFDVGVLAALCRRRPATTGSGPGHHLVEVVHSSCTPHSTGQLRGTHTYTAAYAVAATDSLRRSVVLVTFPPRAFSLRRRHISPVLSCGAISVHS